MKLVKINKFMRSQQNSQGGSPPLSILLIKILSTHLTLFNLPHDPYFFSETTQ